MAIVLLQSRPAIDIVQDSFTRPEAPWEFLGDTEYRARLERAIRGVARMDIQKSDIPFVGTAFCVGPDLVMTGRFGDEYLARTDLTFDFQAEIVPAHGPRFPAECVVLAHPYWDVSFVRVKLPSTVPQLALAIAPPPSGRGIAVIGYPAQDRRNQPEQMNRILRNAFGVKRLLPGRAIGIENYGFEERPALTHDATTLGGARGAPVLDLETGAVLGVHSGGSYLKKNWAVPAWDLWRDPRVRELGVTFAAEPPPADDPWKDLYASKSVAVSEPALRDSDLSSLEAIILSRGSKKLPDQRPAFEVVAGQVRITDDWEDPLAPHRARLDLALRAVGRLVDNHKPLGSCVLVGERFALTTAQIARRFADGDGETVSIRAGRRPVADFSLAVGMSDGPLIVPVERVDMLHPHFDTAILVLGDLPQSLASLPLAATAPEDLDGRLVAVVAHVENRLWVHPGTTQQMSRSGGGMVVNHDCRCQYETNGAPLVDLDTGYVIGICSRTDFSGGCAEPAWELARDPYVWRRAIHFRPDPRPPWLAAWNDTQPVSQRPEIRDRTANHWTVEQFETFEQPEAQSLAKLLVVLQFPGLRRYAEDVGIELDTTGVQLIDASRELMKIAKRKGKLRLLIENICNAEPDGLGSKLQAFL